MDFKNNDIPLSILDIKDDLSTRTLNICTKAGLLSLHAILNFKETIGSFKKLENCGVYAEKELNDLCQKYIKLKQTEFDKTLTEEYRDLEKEKLNPIQKAALDFYIKKAVNGLSIRSLNGLRKISETLDTEDLYNKIVKEDYQFKKIENIGAVTVKELVLFRNGIKLFQLKLLNKDSEQQNKEYTKQLIYLNFPKISQKFELEINNIFDSNQKLKPFRLIQLLIEYGQILSPTEYRIFKDFILYPDDKKETNASIAKELKITGERVRQIRKKLEDNIDSKFSFMSNFSSDDIIDYGIDPTKSFHSIDNERIKKYNNDENVNYSATFYCSILSLILKKEYTNLSTSEFLIEDESTNNQETKNYLVINKIFKTFDLIKFLNRIKERQEEKIKESYALDFKAELNLFTIPSGSKYSEDIKSLFETILKNNFDITVSQKGTIDFERTNKRQSYEYCYEILEAESRPMKLEEICKKISSIYPDLKKTDDSLRESMIRKKDLFVSIGRTSTYGLKKWENEKDDFKGGTIRDMAEKYLLKVGVPKTTHQIFNHIKKYRGTTTENSIWTNLSVDQKKRFSFLGNGLIGLSYKKYS